MHMGVKLLPLWCSLVSPAFRTWFEPHDCWNFSVSRLRWDGNSRNSISYYCAMLQCMYLLLLLMLHLHFRFMLIVFALCSANIRMLSPTEWHCLIKSTPEQQKLKDRMYPAIYSAYALQKEHQFRAERTGTDCGLHCWVEEHLEKSQ
jgi:hypothetical protein